MPTGFELVKGKRAGKRELGRVSENFEKAADRHPFRTGFIVGAVVTVAMTLLIIQNGEPVTFEWLVLDLEWPLWVILFASFVAGIVAWQLFLVEIRRLHKARVVHRRADADQARGAAGIPPAA